MDLNYLPPLNYLKVGAEIIVEKFIEEFSSPRK